MQSTFHIHWNIQLARFERDISFLYISALDGSMCFPYELLTSPFVYWYLYGISVPCIHHIVAQEQC